MNIGKTVFSQVMELPFVDVDIVIIITIHLN